ncbi:hypothetical protein BV22DRAFT_194577 [Leucogyrophana mollusca]|uniref:Uncharacterized protein n=1 Tax=Leucogyrophana mollusca TaxID=85980 RepID=A0ACB8BU93_9AGAM|nr:hypothetical protein BV22DRAFT_194577 [Leucogyrophana mollusca]
MRPKSNELLRAIFGQHAALRWTRAHNATPVMGTASPTTGGKVAQRGFRSTLPQPRVLTTKCVNSSTAYGSEERESNPLQPSRGRKPLSMRKWASVKAAQSTRDKRHTYLNTVAVRCSNEVNAERRQLPGWSFCAIFIFKARRSSSKASMHGSFTGCILRRVSGSHLGTKAIETLCLVCYNEVERWSQTRTYKLLGKSSAEGEGGEVDGRHYS